MYWGIYGTTGMVVGNRIIILRCVVPGDFRRSTFFLSRELAADQINMEKCDHVTQNFIPPRHFFPRRYFSTRSKKCSRTMFTFGCRTAEVLFLLCTWSVQCSQAFVAPVMKMNSVRKARGLNAANSCPLLDPPQNPSGTFEGAMG